MRTTIHRYHLPHDRGGDIVTIKLPVGAQLLHFAFQGSDLYVWAKVVLDFTPEARRFRVVGDDWALGDDNIGGVYRATAFHGRQPWQVWHIFEVV